MATPKTSSQKNREAKTVKLEAAIHRRILIFLAIVVTALLTVQGRSEAATVSFFLSPGTNPNGDLTWQGAVGSFTEFDLNSFAYGQLVQSLSSAGPITVTLGPGTAGQEIFFGAFSGGGGVYGTVSGGALLNRTAGGIPTPTLTFSFSQPVTGFGLWIFDDGRCCPNSFTMTVTEVGGGSVTSGALDAIPGGLAHIVEGFLGATSTMGITSVTITPLGGFFEVDHLQVGGPHADDDNDGVPDGADACPGTAAGDVVDAAGCSIAQYAPCGAVFANHGAYVSEVTRVANWFVREGLITKEQRNAIVAQAAQSDCGK